MYDKSIFGPLFDNLKPLIDNQKFFSDLGINSFSPDFKSNQFQFLQEVGKIPISPDLEFEQAKFLNSLGVTPIIPDLQSEQWEFLQNAGNFLLNSDSGLIGDLSEVIKNIDLQGVSSVFASMPLDCTLLPLTSVLGNISEATEKIFTANTQLADFISGLIPQESEADVSPPVEMPFSDPNTFSRSVPEKSGEPVCPARASGLKIDLKHQVRHVLWNAINAIATLITILQFLLGFLPDSDTIATKQTLAEIVQQEKRQTELLEILVEKERELSELRPEVQSALERLEYIESLLAYDATEGIDVCLQGDNNTLNESKQFVDSGPHPDQDDSLCECEKGKKP